MESKVLGFAFIKGHYEADPEFGEAYKECGKGAYRMFYIHYGLLFMNIRLCIPQGSLRELLIREARGRGLMGYFGVENTLAILK